MTVSEPSPPAIRRNDPGRRDRIIDACIDVIAEHGVDGTTHRRVAAAAGVPLGSMTYHFSGRDELLREALGRFTHQASDRMTARLGEVPAGDHEAAIRAVVTIITEDVVSFWLDFVLTHELYTLAAREPSYRTLTNAWMRRSRVALETCFDPVTARVMDALIEGLTIHRALDTVAADDSDVELAVRRLAGPAR